MNTGITHTTHTALIQQYASLAVHRPQLLFWYSVFNTVLDINQLYLQWVVPKLNMYNILTIAVGETAANYPGLVNRLNESLWIVNSCHLRNLFDRLDRKSDSFVKLVVVLATCNRRVDALLYRARILYAESITDKCKFNC